MLRFTESERRFLGKNELGRLATICPNGLPHVVPVSYAFYREHIWIVVDYGTVKFRNMVKDDRVAFVVDTSNPNRGLLIQGSVEMIEKGRVFREIYSVFYKKFAWVRDEPWDQGEAPFVKIQPIQKANWGLRGR